MAAGSFGFLASIRPHALGIPWLIEAVAEGPLAIVVLFVLAILILTAKAIGWL